MSQSKATTIGNFDGVHIGHQALLRASRNAVGPLGSVIAIAFDPHPISLLRPDQTPPRLTTWQERATLLQAAGADEVVRLEPTAALLGLDPHEFIEQLVEEHHPDVIVEGDDFRFGKGRGGSVETLRNAAGRCGFDVVVVPEVECSLSNQSVVRVSSSLVRWLLERGRVADAACVLGRPYTLTGTVERGDQRGRDLGFPTANLNASDLLLPADGIYSGWVERDRLRYPAAISVGTKPTFGIHARTCEAHILGYDGPLDDYGWPVRFEFDRWLREQITYDSIEALLEQIRTDIARVELFTRQGLATAL